MMKLAVNKTPVHIPGGGFHYLLHPLEMRNQQEVNIFISLGYIIIEVPDAKGDQLIESAQAALAHQLEVAAFTEAALRD